jgi:predicted 2-oxoglutarate/Fe(II)-dependent dioxygenase YbiX
MSTIFYMNDDYEGGEIEFPRFNVSHKPEKNELIIFPSTYVYNHSVLPVTSGTRYAVVSWLR